MKRRFLFSTFAIFSLVAAAPADQRPTMGVLDLAAGQGISGDFLDVCNETLRDAAVTASKYRVQDRAQMQAILNEQKFNASDKCDESCAVEAGRLLQVQFLLSGSVRKLDTTTFIAVRLSDVTTGEVAAAQSAQCPQCNSIEAVNALRKAAEKLFRREVAEPVVVAAAPVKQVAPPPIPEPKAELSKSSGPRLKFVVADNNASYQLHLAATGGERTCDVSGKQVCDLPAFPLGETTLHALGDHEFSQSLTVANSQTTYKIDHRGHAPLFVGIGGLGFAATFYALGKSLEPTILNDQVISGSSSSASQMKGIGTLVGVGASALIFWDLFRWHNKAIEQSE